MKHRKLTATLALVAGLTTGTVATLATSTAAMAHEGRGPGGPGGRGGPGGTGGPGGPCRGQKPGLEAAAKALGVTVDELHVALRGGSTIAKVAESKGVPVATVIDAMVNDVIAKIDADVTAGRLTQAQATEKKDGLRARITTLVNDGPPAKPARPTKAKTASNASAKRKAA